MSLRLEDRALREQAAIRLAELQIQGFSVTKQVQAMQQEFDLSISRRQVGHLRNHPTYKKMILEHTETAIKTAIAELKLGAIHLVPKIIESIEKGVEKGNFGAVSHALKILGVESEEPTKQAQQLTVVMPGASTETPVIEVKKNGT